MHRLMNRTAQLFITDQRKDISIDEIPVELCDEYGSDVDDLEEVQLHTSQKDIFIIISWLTMLFQTPSQMMSDYLQITLPNRVTGIRVHKASLKLVYPWSKSYEALDPYFQHQWKWLPW
jgi:hypothetical protein